MSALRIERREGAAWITIDRPRASNALDLETIDRLDEETESLARDAELRAIVVRGAGARSFIAGGDLKAFAPIRDARGARHMAERARRMLARWEAAAPWIIACVNGDAYGGGCELALACDFIVASESARFGWTQARFALTSGWGGTTRLIERVGRARTRLWLATGAIVDARAALKAGLVDALSPPVELEAHVERLIRDLSHAPRAHGAALKRTLLPAPRVASLARELDEFCALWEASEHHERVASFLARAPATPPDHEESS